MISLPVLPDALRIGPAAVPTAPLFILLGVAAAFVAIGRRGDQAGIDAGRLESTLLWMLAATWVGAKMPELIRSPSSVVSSVRLLLSIPVGALPVVGAAAGSLVGAVVSVRGRFQQLPLIFDALAVPALLGLAVACVGIRDSRAIPLAIGLAAAAGLVNVLAAKARFPGHVFLAAVVLGALAVVLGDLFRPPAATGRLLVTPAQSLAALLALTSYAIARWREGR